MRKLLLCLILFTSQLASAIYCPLYLSETIKRVQSKKMSDAYREFAEMAADSNEKNVVEWYLVNTHFTNDYLLNLAPKGPDLIHKKVSSSHLRNIRKYYEKNIFSNSRINLKSFNEMMPSLSSFKLSDQRTLSFDMKIQELGRDLAKGKTISVIDLLAEQREILKRIKNSDQAVIQASTFIYHLKKYNLIKDTKALNVVFHHFLSDLGLMPSLHGLPSFAKPLEAFNRQTLEKVFWGEYLFADMYSRMKIGIEALDTSGPFIPYVMPVQAIKDSKNQMVNVDINYYELGEFCRANPKKSFKDNLDAYLAHAHKWSVAFNSGKKHDFSEMKSVTADFQKLYFELTARNAEVYKNKMNIFYKRQNLYRGQSYTKKISDDDGLDFFLDFQPEFLSMRSSRGRGIIVKPFVKKDFALYNRLIKKGDARVLEYIKDHMTMGDDYFNSPFASTSKVEHVAKRFSKGFLRDLSHIKKQKSQVIAEYRWRKGYGTVDVNRLRSLTAEWGKDKTVTFGSKYARQQEVMVAGGLAPDELMSLRIIDVEDVTPEKNTGEWIAKAKEVRTRVFERDVKDPSIVHITETQGTQTSKRSFRMDKNFWGNITFKKI